MGRPERQPPHRLRHAPQAERVIGRLAATSRARAGRASG
jgi:hypothetical protein